MAFKKIDVQEQIKEKRKESESFDKLWQESREEYRLIGEMVALRKKSKTTQGEIADITGTKQQVISRIEKHESMPSLRTFCNILNALGYTLKIERSSNSCK